MPRPGGPSRGTVVLLLAALVAGVALRAQSVARARLWLDEYIMLELASLPTPAASDAEGVARTAREASSAGRQVFIIEGADYPVAASLREALGRSFRFRPISPYNRGLFELIPLSRPGGWAAGERREPVGDR
jgi:hypothetical protein